MKFVVKSVVSFAKTANHFEFTVEAESPTEAIFPAIKEIHRLKGFSKKPHGFSEASSAWDGCGFYCSGKTTRTDARGVQAVDNCYFTVLFPSDAEIGLNKSLVETMCKQCAKVKSFEWDGDDDYLRITPLVGEVLHCPRLRTAAVLISILSGDKSIWATMERAKAVL